MDASKFRGLSSTHARPPPTMSVAYWHRQQRRHGARVIARHGSRTWLAFGQLNQQLFTRFASRPQRHTPKALGAGPLDITEEDRKRRSRVPSREVQELGRERKGTGWRARRTVAAGARVRAHGGGGTKHRIARVRERVQRILE